MVPISARAHGSIRRVNLADYVVQLPAFSVIEVTVKASVEGVADGGCNGSARQATGPFRPGLSLALDGRRISQRLETRLATRP